MRTGELRHRLEIQERVETRDETGGQGTNWRRFGAELWGAVEALSGGERARAGIEIAEGSSLIRIRYLADVTPAMRVREIVGDDERLYDILSVQDPDGRRRELHLTVREFSAARAG